MTYRCCPYRLRNRTTAAVTDSPRTSARACAACHTSSGTRTFRSGVGMSEGHDAHVGPYGSIHGLHEQNRNHTCTYSQGVAA